MHGQILEKVGSPLLLLSSTFDIDELVMIMTMDDDVHDDDDDDDDVHDDDEDLLELGGIHVKDMQDAWNRGPCCVFSCSIIVLIPWL